MNCSGRWNKGYEKLKEGTGANGNTNPGSNFRTNRNTGCRVLIYQDYLVREKDDRMILVAFSYLDKMEEYVIEALEAFEAY